MNKCLSKNAQNKVCTQNTTFNQTKSKSICKNIEKIKCTNVLIQQSKWKREKTTKKKQKKNNNKNKKNKLHS